MKTVILDFDGTIADSFGLIVRIAHHMIHRTELVTPEEIVRLRKLRLIDVARELRIPKWRWPLLIMQGRKEMGRHIDQVQLFGGLDRAIKQLHSQGYQLFIVSSNSTLNVRKFLALQGLEEYFSDVYGGVGLTGKARVLRKTVQRNNLNIEDCVYVGDEPRDIEGAHEVGMRCIAVAWGFNTAKLLKEHKPLAVVDTPEALVQVIHESTQV
jgi:phosphoglycolate phosphatase-like HAD superfamily hydrolase